MSFLQWDTIWCLSIAFISSLYVLYHLRGRRLELLADPASRKEEIRLLRLFSGGMIGIWLMILVMILLGGV